MFSKAFSTLSILAMLQTTLASAVLPVEPSSAESKQVTFEVFEDPSCGGTPFATTAVSPNQAVINRPMGFAAIFNSYRAIEIGSNLIAELVVVGGANLMFEEFTGTLLLNQTQSNGEPLCISSPNAVQLVVLEISGSIIA